MPITYTETEIKGLLSITPHIFEDDRGIYKKCYERDSFKKMGISTEFTESSDIFSVKGALRGLHYQLCYSQAKLLYVISGTIFDVALDLRDNSPTFGKVHTELLNSSDNRILYIPEGFAHVR